MPGLLSISTWWPAALRHSLCPQPKTCPSEADGVNKVPLRICSTSYCDAPSKSWLFWMISRSRLPITRPSGICGWSKSSKRSREPFAARMERRHSVAFAAISPRCASKGIRCWRRSRLSLLVILCLSLGHLSSYDIDKKYSQILLQDADQHSTSDEN